MPLVTMRRPSDAMAEIDSMQRKATLLRPSSVLSRHHSQVASLEASIVSVLQQVQAERSSMEATSSRAGLGELA